MVFEIIIFVFEKKTYLCYTHIYKYVTKKSKLNVNRICSFYSIISFFGVFVEEGILQLPRIVHQEQMKPPKKWLFLNQAGPSEGSKKQDQFHTNPSQFHIKSTPRLNRNQSFLQEVPNESQIKVSSYNKKTDYLV